MKPISYNTYLKFYRAFMSEDKARAAAREMMAKQHKFIRGAQK